MRSRQVFAVIVGFSTLIAAVPPGSAAERVVRQVPYEQLTPAERTLARQLGRRARYDELTFCADPGNMPLSNREKEGYLNAIAEIVAEELGARLKYFWRPFYERGLTRENFRYRNCDVVIEVPVDYPDVLTTVPVYRSTYVFAVRRDSGIRVESFADPVLREKRLGVFQHSAVRIALKKYGISDGYYIHPITHDADLRPELQPWRLAEKVLKGELDIVGIWGPFAGWLVARGEPLELIPVNLWEDEIVLEFDMALAVPRTNAVLKFALDYALLRREKDIRAVLKRFGVPLVRCSACVVDGALPAHGPYRVTDAREYARRFLEPVPEEHRRVDPELASPDQIVTLSDVQAEIEAGTELRELLSRAVLASDRERVRYLLARGADPNAPNRQGQPPLVIAAMNRDPEMIDLLLRAGAEVDATDRAGMTALHHAVLRNHVPTIERLLEGGADMYRRMRPAGLSALALAISEGKRWAAKVLVEHGADVDERIGEDGITPLMLLATQDEAFERVKRIVSGPSVVELAQLLLDHGADVNAQSEHGITPLMIAAANNNVAMLGFLLQAGADAGLRNARGETALDLARKWRRKEAVQMLRLFQARVGGRRPHLADSLNRTKEGTQEK